MKSTGMIRRIDELGRIVIPKEIRKNLMIRDGENLEIYIEKEHIILQKVSQIEDVNSYIKKIVNIISNITEINFLVTDRNKIIAFSGEKMEPLLDKNISISVYNYLSNRENYINKESEKIFITKEDYLIGYFQISPIIVDADSIGTIILYREDSYDNSMDIIAKLLTKLIEEKLDIS